MALWSNRLTHTHRAAGDSAVEKAAYVGRLRMRDLRTGKLHNYSTGADDVLASGVVGWTGIIEDLANKMEQADKRVDASVAFQYKTAGQAELGEEGNIRLTVQFAERISRETGLPLFYALHRAPEGGDARNVHPHFIGFKRRVLEDGTLSKTKNREFAPGRPGLDLLQRVWEEMCNAALRAVGSAARVDRRSYAARGIEKVPTRHEGPRITYLRRRKKILVGRAAENAAIIEDRIAVESARKRAAAQGHFSPEESAATSAAKPAEGAAICATPRAPNEGESTAILSVPKHAIGAPNGCLKKVSNAVSDEAESWGYFEGREAELAEAKEEKLKREKAKKRAFLSDRLAALVKTNDSRSR